MAFRLRHEDGEANGSGPLEMAPTRGTREGDHIRLRFNVMQGPGQVPLAPGRWRLVRTGTAGDGARSRSSSPTPARSIRRGTAAPSSSIRASSGRSRRSIRRTARCRSRSAWRTPTAASDETAARPSPGPFMRPLRFLRLGLFGVLFRLFRAVTRRNGRRILFSSDSRAELGGNLKIVYDRMVERGLDREYELLTLFKSSVTERRSLSDRVRLPWLLARADVIVIDDYQPVIYRVDDPDVRIIQLWHAWGAFKTVGYSRVGKPGGPSPYSRAHKNYTHAIVSSDAEVPFYAEAFGIPEARVAPTGIPRMDRFFDPGGSRGRPRGGVRAFPEARGRTAILFAPTFRGNGAKSADVPCRAARLRVPACPVRREGRGLHHPAAPVRAGAARHPGVACATGSSTDRR